ncbi:MAG: dihydrolipoamide acetyltransferase family protein [Leptospirillia bacterium]
MKTPIPLPVLSDTMKTGRLTGWLKQPGDPVKAGEALATMESDKAVMDVEAFSDGFLAGPLAPPGTEIPVGSTIGYLCSTREECGETKSSPAEAPPAPAQPAASPAPSPSNPGSPPPAPHEPPPVRTTAGLPATPYARGLASDLQISLETLAPGHDGLIHARQVIEAALGRQDPDLSHAPPSRLRPPTAMENAVARNMGETRGTPVFHLTARFSLAPLVQAAKSHNLSLTLALVRACALAVSRTPRLNSLWTRQGILERDRIDVGVAVDTGEGLVTPVLRDAGARPLSELREDWRILKQKAQLGRLVPEDYSGGTFYLSNLGTFPEVLSFDAIIPSSAGAILAVAAPDENGSVHMTLACDHRTLYGAHAARFMGTLGSLLSAPEEWMGGVS